MQDEVLFSDCFVPASQGPLNFPVFVMEIELC